MNEANPFQIPAWSRINQEQRRRERFKRVVIATVVVAVLGLVTSLLLGIKTELAARQLQSTPGLPDVPEAAPQPSGSVPAPSQTPAPVSSLSTTVYVVKTGDTLTVIAKAHGTTIQAIESANDLNSDRIVIGQRLRIPKAGGPH